MCLIVKEKIETRREAREFAKNRLVAKKNIRVYKLLEIPYGFLGEIKTYLSPYRGFVYTLGQTYSAKLSCNFSFGGPPNFHYNWQININKGLHSYRNIDAATNQHLARNSYIEIIEMYIPKGAEYFLGEKDEIVSSKLVFKQLRKKTIK